MKNLLFRPEPGLLKDVGKALAAAARAFPIPRGHRDDLPFAVRDLSRLLTEERGGLSQAYWTSPRFLSAYLRYFLPWNLYRLSWLLPSLDLPLEEGGNILDLGSGPLTLPLALWCARPNLRDVPLTFTCCDTSLRPMEIGRDILRALAGEKSPWRVFLVRATLDAALAARGGTGKRGAPPLPLFAPPPESAPLAQGHARASAPQREVRFEGGPTGRFDCILAGNVLNELPAPRHMTLEERLEQLMRQAFHRLTPGGRMLLVEPGTRLGGKTVALCRKGALAGGFTPLAPCPHSGPCPMIAQEQHYPPSPPYTGWCHFFHPAVGAPETLLALGKKARLEKSSLAMSCLLLARPPAASDPSPARGEARDDRAGLSPARLERPQAQRDNTAAAQADEWDDLEALYQEMLDEDAGGGSATGKRPAQAKATSAGGTRPEAGHAGDPGAYGVARVISDLIRLPGHEEPGRYACCAKGLALLLDAARIPSGGAVLLPWPEEEQRDEKTGALFLRHTVKHRSPNQQTPDRQTPDRQTPGRRGAQPHAAAPRIREAHSEDARRPGASGGAKPRGKGVPAPVSRAKLPGAQGKGGTPSTQRKSGNRRTGKGKE